MYLLLDDDNIIRCMASEECNLHKDKIAAGMRKVTCANPKGTIGDKYFQKEDRWEAHPENYPQPSEKEIQEELIQNEINKIVRAQAIANLKSEGKLPVDFKEMGE